MFVQSHGAACSHKIHKQLLSASKKIVQNEYLSLDIFNQPLHK